MREHVLAHGNVVGAERGENPVDNLSYGKIAELANGARGTDNEGYRAEFVRLVRMAETLGTVAQR